MPVQFDSESEIYSGSHAFVVKIEGIQNLNTSFVRVAGLVSETVEGSNLDGSGGARESGSNTEFAPIRMVRVFKGMDDLYKWRLEVEKGNVQPRNVNISMIDAMGAPVRAMVLMEAWPSKWEMPAMEVHPTEPPTEAITLSARRVIESAVGEQAGPTE